MPRLHRFLIIPFCVASALPWALQDQRESRMVYQAVLDSIHGAGRNAYFVADQTVSLQPTDRWEQSLRSRASHPEELVTLLVRTNETPESIDPNWIDSVSTMPADPALEQQMVGSRWRIAFSRVAFSPDAATALVYVMEVCGGRCGSGGVVRLEKEATRWRISHWEPVMRF